MFRGFGLTCCASRVQWFRVRDRHDEASPLVSSSTARTTASFAPYINGTWIHGKHLYRTRAHHVYWFLPTPLIPPSLSDLPHNRRHPTSDRRSTTSAHAVDRGKLFEGKGWDSVIGIFIPSSSIQNLLRPASPHGCTRVPEYSKAWRRWRSSVSQTMELEPSNGVGFSHTGTRDRACMKRASNVQIYSALFSWYRV